MKQVRHDEIRVNDIIRLNYVDWWRVTRVVRRPSEIGICTVWIPKPGYQGNHGMPGYLSGPADETQEVLRHGDDGGR